jgi:hypothetical protein
MSDENENEVSYDAYGFNAETGLHRDTGTLYDENGFDWEGLHPDTETAFHPTTRLTRDGNRRDDEGYDFNGRDAYGFDRDGYGRDGYNEDGEDCDGNTRCDNGDCDDDECETCRPERGFENHLLPYGEKVERVHGWSMDPRVTLYAGHEFEMYSRREDYSDVEDTLTQLNDLYATLAPLTRTRRCAIAKHDGSLGEWGFETVTVPLTDAQMYGIFTKFKTLGDGGCAAWNRGDEVGHHVHLSRAAIAPLTLGKMLVFMNAEANREFLTAIAGRDCRTYAKFATKKLTDGRNHDRYEVLNVTNKTVEFRLFKSNLRSEAILKNHEFCKAVLAFCEGESHGFGVVASALDPLHWTRFRAFVAANRGSYAYLHRFLLTHSSLRNGYCNNSGLPENVANPKERSPMFSMIRTQDALQSA